MPVARSGAAGLGAWIGAAAAVCGGVADAHHSIAAVYDARRPLTLTAVVREFRFVAPHPSILVDVVAVTAPADAAVDDVGVWTLEMDNRWELAELGFAADTLRPGDRITVSGSLGRERDKALYVRRLEHPPSGLDYVHHR